MSGITGIYYRDGRPIAPSLLQRMGEVLAHRGPDKAGTWIGGAVGLGHRLLWTTPESLQEHLPQTDASEGLVITADARLDNRAELMAALGITEQSITDSALILKAYERWGEQCPDKLLGDFAFAIWDSQHRRLFCARDHFGAKPFYYYHSPQLFAFASEIKGLFCLPEVRAGQINEGKIAEYLASTVGDKTTTFYHDILRLPPGHSLTISSERSDLRCYWAPTLSQEIRYRSDQEYAEAFLSIFTEAVRCRLRSAFPVGIAMSGGLDSTAIAAVARALSADGGGRCLQVFSRVFVDHPGFDERPYINAMLAQGGLEPYFLPADRLSPLGDVERVFAYHDEPIFFPQHFLAWGLYDAVSQHRGRTLLDGIDGNTVLSGGTGYLAELLHTGRWTTLLRETKALSKRSGTPVWSLLWNHALISLVPLPLLRAYRPLPIFSRLSRTPNSLLRPDFARRVGLAHRLRALREMDPRLAPNAREEHRRSLTANYQPLLLEHLEGGAAAFSLDLRHPYYDRRLVEFCLALPGAQKLQDGWNRMVVRRAMAGALPDTVLWRFPDRSRRPNFSRALLAFDRTRLDDILLNKARVIEPYVDLNALRRVYMRYISQQRVNDAVTIWRVAMLALWLSRTFWPQE